MLRSILRARPLLRRLLVRCQHCRIFFLTDPRNADRLKLGCPFGCKECHRKEAACARSVAYYQTKDGKRKKSVLNGKRRARNGAAPPEATPPQSDPVPPSTSSAEGNGTPWPTSLVAYLRMAVSLIEARRVSSQEILEMLARVLRQLSMVRRRRIDQIIDWLNEPPP